MHCDCANVSRSQSLRFPIKSPQTVSKKQNEQERSRCTILLMIIISLAMLAHQRVLH